MNRGEVLATALSYITKDRAATHGDAEDSFAEIAAYWSIYVHRHCPDGIIEGHDVAALMVLFKVARLGGNPLHDDNWVDTAGYAALGAELAHGFHYPTEVKQSRGFADAYGLAECADCMHTRNKHSLSASGCSACPCSEFAS